jgi:DNA polymerase (family 10)
LAEYADLLAITGGDAYRVRNYEKAARAVAGYHLDVGLLDEEGLDEIPAVGASIAAKILQLVDHGSFDELDERRSQVPAGLRSLLTVPGLGPSGRHDCTTSWAFPPSPSCSTRSTVTGSSI